MAQNANNIYFFINIINNWFFIKQGMASVLQSLKNWDDSIFCSTLFIANCSVRFEQSHEYVIS